MRLFTKFRLGSLTKCYEWERGVNDCVLVESTELRGEAPRSQKHNLAPREIDQIFRKADYMFRTSTLPAMSDFEYRK